jgi:hypothetical protein
VLEDNVNINYQLHHHIWHVNISSPLITLQNTITLSRQPVPVEQLDLLEGHLLELGVRVRRVARPHLLDDVQSELLGAWGEKITMTLKV